jgi:Sec-independent protein secretion pathway component TatC
MCLLYELGILAARFFIEHTQAPEPEAQAETEHTS